MKNENLQKTNLGINVPDGWEVVKLKDLFDEKKILSSDSKKYPLYSFTIENGVCPKSDRYNREHLLKNKAENKYRIIHKDDFIYNPMNLRFGALGRSKIEFPVAVSAYYNIFESKDKSANNYLEAYLKSPRIMNIYDRVAIGSLLEKKRVHMSIFENIEIPYPPKKERDFIAQILTTWDTAIEKTEQLLTQLRRRKQGLMQRLLSGKQRLPGFVEEWEKVQLGEVVTIINGKAYKKEELLSSGKYRVLRVGNLFTNSSWYYSDLELDEKKYIESGDLIYAWSASFGPRFWEEEKVIYHYHIWKIVTSDAISKFYLYFFLDFDAQSILSKIQGGTMAHLTKGDMEKRKFKLPSLKEQTSIATILSQADQEIEKTENYLTKLREQKKGLMQELLTGQRRVKV